MSVRTNAHAESKDPYGNHALANFPAVRRDGRLVYPASAASTLLFIFSTNKITRLIDLS